MDDEQATGTRPYRMRKRLQGVAETRQRIVEAAVELHGSVGPAHTTFSAVADRAGVQRSTVYRHFPDEEALFGACTSHWVAQHPWPRPDDWEEVADPTERLRRGLGELYRFYEENREMITNSYRDMDVIPGFVAELIRAQLDAMYRVLLQPWPATDERLSAALAHALDFRAWQSLESTGLEPEQAAELMTSMVSALSPT